MPKDGKDVAKSSNKRIRTRSPSSSPSRSPKAVKKLKIDSDGDVKEKDKKTETAEERELRYKKINERTAKFLRNEANVKNVKTWTLFDAQLKVLGKDLKCFDEVTYVTKLLTTSPSTIEFHKSPEFVSAALQQLQRYDAVAAVTNLLTTSSVPFHKSPEFITAALQHLTTKQILAHLTQHNDNIKPHERTQLLQLATHGNAVLPPSGSGNGNGNGNGAQASLSHTNDDEKTKVKDVKTKAKKEKEKEKAKITKAKEKKKKEKEKKEKASKQTSKQTPKPKTKSKPLKEAPTKINVKPSLTSLSLINRVLEHPKDDMKGISTTESSTGSSVDVASVKPHAGPVGAATIVSLPPTITPLSSPSNDSAVATTLSPPSLPISLVSTITLPTLKKGMAVMLKDKSNSNVGKFIRYSGDSQQKSVVKWRTSVSKTELVKEKIATDKLIACGLFTDSE